MVSLINTLRYSRDDERHNQERGIVRGILVASDFDSKAKAAARDGAEFGSSKIQCSIQFSDGHA